MKAATMRSLGEILTEPGQRAGVLAVLDAADAHRAKLEDAQYLASFAPPPIFYGSCPCGSVMEVRPASGRDELTAEDCDAIREWTDQHDYCEAD